jgi:hypothetical protein
MHDDAAERGGPAQPGGRVRRVALYAAGLLAAFLLGLVPMWMSARGRAVERDRAQTALRVSTLQNTLANAAVDARQGRYEPARQAASEFYTGLLAEIERGRDSAFDEARQSALRPLLDARDDLITLLARNDPASADRLADLYTKYRQLAGGAPPG